MTYRCSKCEFTCKSWPAFERHADAEHGGAIGWLTRDPE